MYAREKEGKEEVFQLKYIKNEKKRGKISISR